MYNAPYPGDLPDHLRGADKNFILQAKDHGEFWDEQVAVDALEYVATMSENNNVVVVLFIHGWHHNASPDDSNLRHFFQTLHRLKTHTNGTAQATETARYTINTASMENKDTPVHIVGIYLGWRGRSLPWLFDYLTFWGRKSTAEQVGNGAFAEFMIRLNRLYRKRNEPDGDHFMGLVSIGHSFGSLVLLSATRDTVNYELIRRTSWLQQPVYDTEDDVQGFGDLMVLINPALETSLFTRMQRIYSRFHFSERQLPLLLAISAHGDLARRCWFPLGRLISCIFHSNFVDYRERITALGFLPESLTHTAEKVQSNIEALSRDDLLHNFTFANVHFTVKPEYAGKNCPFMVAEVTKSVIPDHNRIFEKSFIDFLIHYVTAVESKRAKRKIVNRMSADTPLPRVESELPAPAPLR